MDAVDREIQATLRRVEQRTENIRIGDDAQTVQVAEFMTEADLLTRCVYVETGRRVAILPREPNSGQRARVLTLEEFGEAYLASGELMGGAGGGRWISFVERWRRAQQRQTCTSLVLGIGRPRFMKDFDGHSAVNIWTPTVRPRPAAGWEERVAVFLRHVDFLIPVQREREQFLDWLAHCEQQPQVLPHHGYLMFTETFGIGRNWLASVLVRVWRGEVAASVNLPALIDSGFNGSISGKRLAVVDEVHVSDGGRSRYAVESRLRQLLTEEVRIINPKYGREHSEWSALRWLLLSNHPDAIPMPRHDRRFAVIQNPSVCLSPDHYASLYGQLDDPAFIGAVGWFLAQRDISAFRPGAMPELNDAKLTVIDATTPELDKELAAVMHEWQAPVAAAEDLIRVCGIGESDQRARAHFGMAMRRAGHQKLGRVALAGRNRAHVWLLKGRKSPASLDETASAVAEYRAAAWFKLLTGAPDAPGPF